MSNIVAHSACPQDKVFKILQKFLILLENSATVRAQIFYFVVLLAGNSLVVHPIVVSSSN